MRIIRIRPVGISAAILMLLASSSAAAPAFDSRKQLRSNDPAVRTAASLSVLATPSAFNAAARRIALNNLVHATDRQAASVAATDVLLDGTVDSSSRALAALVVGRNSLATHGTRADAQAALVSCLTELAPAHMLEVALDAAGDTFVRGTHPNTNFGSSPVLEVRNGFPSRSLVSFQLDTLLDAADGATVEYARVQFTATRVWPSWPQRGGGIGIHRVLDQFDPSSATWRCAADANLANNSTDCAALWGMTGTSLAYVETATSTALGPFHSQVEFDVLDDILRHTQGAQHWGWLLRKEHEDNAGRIELGSIESMTPPRLNVGLTDPRRHAFPLNVRRACAEAAGLAKLSDEISLLLDVSRDSHDDAFVSFAAARSATRITQSAEVTPAIIDRILVQVTAP